ncbi:hypothetical protein AB0C69_08420 [Actinomadura sp. NPDC048032]|uniref:hypothetical protein n=1 Tax=Actinomadura sp. NPDC048032 TaxID=3155747 RepID=UPI0033CD1D94
MTCTGTTVASAGSAARAGTDTSDRTAAAAAPITIFLPVRMAQTLLARGRAAGGIGPGRCAGSSR